MMNKKMMYGLLMAFVLFSGCGGDSRGSSGDDVSSISDVIENNTSDNSNNMEKGIFTNVSGLSYKSSSGEEGILDDKGMFEYKKNDNIDFFIKDIHLGTIKAKKEISVFSFKNPKLVAQTLYSLDSDLNPSNGLQIDVKKIDASNKIGKRSVYQKTTKIDLDTLDDESEDYGKLIASYGGDLVDSSEAVNTELFTQIEESTLKVQREYKYLAGDFPLPSTYNYYEVEETQKNIKYRIGRLIYINNFMLYKQALSSKYSKDINAIDDDYKAYVSEIQKQIKEFSLVTSELSAYMKGEFVKSTLYEGVKYGIDKGVEEAQLVLGEGTGSKVVGATGKTLNACIDKNDAKGAVACLSDTTSEITTLYFEEKYKDEPIYQGLGTGISKVANNTAQIYLTCKDFLSDGDFGLGCVSKVGTTAYEYVNEALLSAAGIWAISSTQTEFNSKNVAYSLLEDYSYLGTLLELKSFYNITDAEVKKENSLVRTLLKAKYQKMYTNNENFDIEVADDFYRKLLSKWNRQYNLFITQSKYQKLFIKKGNNIVGIADGFKKSYFTRGVNLVIDNVNLLKEENSNESDKYYLDLCYSIKNNGVRDINLKGKEIKVTSEGGEYNIDISNIEGLLTAGHPSNKLSYCNKYYLDTFDVLTFKKNFLVSVEFKGDIKEKVKRVVDLPSMELKDYKLYEGVNIPFISPINLTIFKENWNLKNETDRKDISGWYFEGVGVTPSFRSDDYTYEWSVTGGTIDKTKQESASKIFFNLDKENGNVKLKLFDKYRNLLAQTSINVEKYKEVKKIPFSVSNVYKSVKSGELVTIRPVIMGGENPYSINFDTSEIDNLEIVKKTEGSIVIKINSSEMLKDYIVNYTVVDGLDEKRNAKATITVSSSLVSVPNTPAPVVESEVKLELGDNTILEEQKIKVRPFTISDDNHRITKVVCSSNPSGITISNTNKKVTITAPNYNMIKEFTVSCIAYDANSALDSDEITVTVTKKTVSPLVPISEDDVNPIPDTPPTSTPSPPTSTPISDELFEEIFGVDDTITDDYSSTHSTSTTTLATSLNGKIETNGDVDAFKIIVAKSGELTLYTTGLLDTFGVLYDSTGEEIANNDDADDGNFKITHIVTRGVYYLDVRGFDTSIGGYSVYKEFIEKSDSVSSDGKIPQNKLVEIYNKWTENELFYGNTVTYAKDLGDVYGISTENRYHDISAFEKISGVKFSVDGSTDVECKESSNKCYSAFSQSFLSVNPQMLTWVLDNLLTPSPRYNKIQEFYNSKGKEFFLPFVYAYKYLHENKNFTNEVNAYNEGINQNKYMPSYLRDKYEGESIGNTTPYHIGFWLRRGIDGSDQAVFNALKKILETYDSNLLNILLTPIDDTITDDLLDDIFGVDDSTPTDDYSSTHSTATTTLSSSSAHSDTLNGKIEIEDDIDAFKIIIVDSGTLTLYTTGSIDTLGKLYNSAGEVLTVSDDDGDAYNFRIAYPVTRGVYYLDVIGYLIGDYIVHEEFEKEVVDTRHPAEAVLPKLQK